jgi:hypothetical protein
MDILCNQDWHPQFFSKYWAEEEKTKVVYSTKLQKSMEDGWKTRIWEGR